MVFQMFASGPQSLQSSDRSDDDDDPDDDDDDDARVDLDDVDEPADDAGEAIPSSVEGTEETICDSVDWVLVPVEVVVAWLTASAWLARPLGLEFCCGPVNGVSCVAAADEPA